jgi:hypothetical protein
MYSGQKIVMLNARDKSGAWTLPVKEWAMSQWGQLFCGECHTPKRELYPTPIDVYLCQLPKGTSYSGLFRAMVGVIHQRLLDVLRDDLPAHARGRCFWEDGTEIPEYSSIYFPDTFIVRGHRKPRHPPDRFPMNYVCQTCGAVLGASADELYVLREEMPEARVFQEPGSNMYLAEDVARRFPWKQFRDLEPWVIEVREEPLPDDPVPVRPFKPRLTSISAPLIAPVPTPAFEPVPRRYAELKAMSPEFPRLQDDSRRSCPVPMRKIMGYLLLEMGDSCPKARELEFLRTAQVDDRACWIWRFQEQVRADAFVTVWRDPDGKVIIGYRSNTEGLTPEQYIYGEHHGML